MTTPDPATSEISKCPTCGVTKITFDPPIFMEEKDPCGVAKPGNYANPLGGIPVCEIPAGHDGNHGFLVEYLDQWPQ